jgi:hypothetical protein
MVWFILMQPFHIAYTVVSGWLGKVWSYRWKGRKVKMCITKKQEAINALKKELN